jgi:hypothetical protein
MPQSSSISPKVDFDRSTQATAESQKTFKTAVTIANFDATFPTDQESAQGVQKRFLIERDYETISHYIRNAGVALKSTGLVDPDKFLPSPYDVVIFHSENGGYCTADYPVGTIRLVLPERMNVPDLEMEQLLYHEITHFITKAVFHMRTDDAPDKVTSITEVSYGFSRLGVPFGKDWRTGVFDEPLGELFAMRALEVAHPDEHIDYRGTYVYQTAFMMAFLEKYAELKGISPLEAFNQTFKAKVLQDYSYFTDVVNHFSKLGLHEETGKEGRKRALDFTQALNLISTTPAKGVTEEGLETMSYAAWLGGFYDDYVGKWKLLSAGQAVVFPEMKVSFMVGNFTLR